MNAKVVFALLLAVAAIANAAAVQDAAVVDAEEFDAEIEFGADAALIEVEDDAEDDAQDDVEAEDEAEADAEDDAEDESEAEADDALEVESESAAAAEQTAEFEAAIGERRGKWHVYSSVVTEQAHEGICQAALQTLPAADQAKFDLAKLKHGAIWNDMPSGAPSDEAAMIKDGHMDIDTWTRLFMATGGVDDLVFNVHYGCLQHWHSMAPIQRLEAKNAAATRLVFTNAQVADFTKQQIYAWWNRAVQLKANKAHASWYLGHILHALQDSYPRGHVVRDSTATTCGNVVLFQGYDAQHGNAAHKGGDYTPSHKNKEADPSFAKRYACAKDASAAILAAFARCNGGGGVCTTAAISGTVDGVYTFAAGAASRIAGGSEATFAKAGIATDANYVKEVVAGKTLYNPKSTRRWGAGRTLLCGGSRAIQSKVPSGLGFYREADFNGYVSFQG